MRYPPRPLLAALLAASAGVCLAANPATRPATPAPAPAVDADAPPTDTLTTPLPPPEATRAAMLVFERYRTFQLEVQHDNNDQPYVSTTPGSSVTASGNYFQTTAIVSVGVDVHADLRLSCKWVRDGQTTVEFSSDLPPAAHALVLSQVRAALAAAATRPAGN